jgi:hypothetical protein
MASPFCPYQGKNIVTKEKVPLTLRSPTYSFHEERRQWIPAIVLIIHNSGHNSSWCQPSGNSSPVIMSEDKREPRIPGVKELWDIMSLVLALHR